MNIEKMTREELLRLIKDQSFTIIDKENYIMRLEKQVRNLQRGLGILF